MKKKISIILRIIICLFLVGIVIILSLNNYSQMQNNKFVSADDVELENKEENIIENTVLEEKIEVTENKESEETTNIENKDVSDDKKKENNKTITSNNKVVLKENTTQKETTKPKENTNSANKNEEKIESNNTEKTKEDIVENKEDTSIDKTTTNNTKTEEVKETPKCNHSNEKYYNTEEEAIAFYKKTSKEYGDKVKNGEITYEEYLKKCPYGYETMSCPYCQKWTISFYYE